MLIKGIFNPKIIIRFLSADLQGIQDVGDVVSSVFSFFIFGWTVPLSNVNIPTYWSSNIYFESL